MTQAPPATGERTPWSDLPAHVEQALTEKLGAPVRHARTRAGGFSPGVAASVTLADGRRAFVKAVSAEANPHSPNMHRREAENAARLPPEAPVPRLLATYDDGTWVALVFEDIQGSQPHVPWRQPELTRVLEAVGALSATLTPAPFPAPRVADDLAKAFAGWRHLADPERAAAARLDPWTARNVHALAELAAPWGEFASGDTLVHGDLRADNILLTEERVVFVDWPHAMRAAPWLDLLVMLPCVRAQGGPDPEELFTAHPSGRDADPEGVTRTLAGLTGFFLGHAARPAPPGLPTLRAFQRAQGEAALAWLKRRLRNRAGCRPLVPDLP
ncbi:phosphotransferase [Streptomyces sp. SID8379]|uniref:phosphotransferase family protein n=1 Tax=unclassified Streptomyces TaxID=2593676 RepID=UPI0003798D8F|nr:MULTISPECIES: aminoglycoside phosphotransferase family protein [unclassified Streptomyces]MYW65149.1 phosphotransferase [Streptomyces sp. SID8379]